jgi:hypothetical protein
MASPTRRLLRGKSHGVVWIFREILCEPDYVLCTAGVSCPLRKGCRRLYARGQSVPTG